ncbi:hypothetical protein [Paenibacillus germinis]|nr:hypothetical protein [Paenibacillus germinis]
MVVRATDKIREPQYRMEYFDGSVKKAIGIERTPRELFELEHQISFPKW